MYLHVKKYEAGVSKKNSVNSLKTPLAKAVEELVEVTGYARWFAMNVIRWRFRRGLSVHVRKVV